jgi:hypothetical protein
MWAAGAIPMGHTTPPVELVIEFTGASATLVRVDEAQAQAYGSSVTLHWTGAPPAPSAGLPEVLILCTVSPVPFGFTSAAS